MSQRLASKLRFRELTLAKVADLTSLTVSATSDRGAGASAARHFARAFVPALRFHNPAADIRVTAAAAADFFAQLVGVALPSAAAAPAADGAGAAILQFAAVAERAARGRGVSAAARARRRDASARKNKGAAASAPAAGAAS